MFLFDSMGQIKTSPFSMKQVGEIVCKIVKNLVWQDGRK